MYITATTIFDLKWQKVLNFGILHAYIMSCKKMIGMTHIETKLHFYFKFPIFSKYEDRNRKKCSFVCYKGAQH